MHNSITKYSGGKNIVFFCVRLFLGFIFLIFTLGIVIKFGLFYTCLLRLAIILIFALTFSISPMPMVLYIFQHKYYFYQLCANIIGFIVIIIIYIHSGIHTVYCMDEIQEFIGVTKQGIEEFQAIIISTENRLDTLYSHLDANSPKSLHDEIAENISRNEEAKRMLKSYMWELANAREQEKAFSRAPVSVSTLKRGISEIEQAEASVSRKK